MGNSTIDKVRPNKASKERVVNKPRIERNQSNNRKKPISRRNKKSQKSKKISIITYVFTTLFSLGTIGIITVLVLLYGPFNGFRDWLVTTAMTTMTHQYFATWFYDDETIDYILDRNKVIETGLSTDANAINVASSKNQVTEYKNEYERAILERDENNNDYKIIEISGKTYDGYIVAVYDPSRIKTVATNQLGVTGQYLTKMAKNNDALIAVNGGGFVDPNFNSTGGIPLGITICDGAYVTQASYNGPGGIIGFTSDDKLYLGPASTKKAKELGIRDAVTFGPFLIVNGEASKIKGNGGWGQAPRTAIAQRKDGIVLFLILNGRKGTKVGASIADLIEILKNYGAYNAANLDGGTSSVLVVGDTIVNDPIDSTGAHKTRPIATGFILTKDDHDDSDHSVVADKLGEE